MGKGKRQAEESLSQPEKKKVDDVKEAKAINGAKVKKVEEVEEAKMEEDDDIEFEDAYEDEYEEEEIIENEDDEDEDEDEDEEQTEEQRRYWAQAATGELSTIDDEGLEEDDNDEDDDDEDDEKENAGPKQVWRPGDALEEGEELDYDPSTYSMLHSLGTQWPCLSFGFIPDTLGGARTKYPHTLLLAAGTQAADGDGNSLIVMKVSRMNKTNEDSDYDDDDSDDEGEQDDPILETASLATQGVNRIKVMPQQNKNILVGMWADTGKVHVYDIQKYIAAADTGSSSSLPKKEPSRYQVSKHANEGFALDWSPNVPGRLLTGDCNRLIYETDFYTATTIAQPYDAHTASVEDLQWSPSEKDVFASCSVDTTVKIWDSRATARKAMISVKAHQSDVNTLSWNKKVPYLLATGSDDCSFRIWDLRNFKPDATVAHFTFHEKPICCVEWNPNDDSQLVVVSEDNQVTIWDMGLEADDGEEKSEFPPQLFFVHQGQHEVKEAHWHPQIPNLVGTTSADGFNLFITANSTEVAPPARD